MMKKIYLQLDNQNRVVSLTEQETACFYCEVEESVDLEEVKNFLGVSTKKLKWQDSALVEVTEELLQEENEHLKEEVKTLNERLFSLEEAVLNIL
ncbi:DUF5320 domain-containing protein [Aerococcaceae bacterium NML160702]|nr:DUF5320 domain-containing protein [Aerococcaceae bacterium NML160702]